MCSHTSTLVNLNKKIGNSLMGPFAQKPKGCHLNSRCFGASHASAKYVDTAHEICCSNFGHDALCKIGHLEQCCIRVQVQITRECDEVAKINGLDSNRARCLASKSLLARWTGAVADNQNRTNAIRRRDPSSFHTLDVVLRGPVESNPGQVGGSSFQIDALARLQPVTDE
jgi:hypothetical protein